MSDCKKCGRPAENGEPTHWLGCKGIGEAEVPPRVYAELCEYPDCGKPKKPWSGKGAKPKYCADGHKKEK